MSVVKVEKGHGNTIDVNLVAIECPFCHSRVAPNYHFMHDQQIFASCPNSDCNRHFVLCNNGFGFSTVLPNFAPAQKRFSEIINQASPEFSKIYNQAFYAEQVALDHICGVGYRKALEFLIKDYLLSSIPEENVERRDSIKSKFLGRCIEEDVLNEKIKIVAKRAVWLGNDETHYVRKWTGKDVSHLKQLIELTVHWIESEIELQRLEADMPE